MDKTQVLKLLGEVKYPGFSRDIVSFGMVEEVEVSGDTVTVTLKITTQQEEKRQAVVNEVRSRLEDCGAFQNVAVRLVSGPPAAPPTAPTPAARTLEGVKHVIAIASGKGGVGKSTVAANLALALKERGLAVGLLDLDIYGPSLPIILGLNRQPEMNQNQKLVPLEQYGLKVMSFGFISGNTSPVIWRGPLVARMTEQFFGDVEWGKLDFLILDLPPGTGDVQLTLTQSLRLSGAIMVTTPQDIALEDVRKGADMFRKVNTPVLGVVENMSGLKLEGRVTDARGAGVPEVTLNIKGLDGEPPVQVDAKGEFAFTLDLFKRGGGARESQRLGVPLLGVIPISQEMMAATDEGIPLVLRNPDAPETAVYHQIVEQIITHLAA